MSNPTTPFSWQMPTATDLVTDLPADFEVFGQAVATSMADLLGGTTGQVLSKTSATDMAFTWVDTDDTNAIQNAIVTAKGDLIGASASATPLVLAVGADGTQLVADSAEATGLKWVTPTASASGLTLITSGTWTSSSGFSVNNCFSATYKNYKLVFTSSGRTGAVPTVTMKFRVSGTDNSANYTWIENRATTAATPVQTLSGSTATTSFQIASAGDSWGASMEVYAPAVAIRTNCVWQGQCEAGASALILGGMQQESATAYDGFSIIFSNAYTSGNYYVYGYGV